MTPTAPCVSTSRPPTAPPPAKARAPLSRRFHSPRRTCLVNVGGSRFRAECGRRSLTQLRAGGPSRARPSPPPSHTVVGSIPPPRGRPSGPRAPMGVGAGRRGRRKLTVGSQWFTGFPEPVPAASWVPGGPPGGFPGERLPRPAQGRPDGRSLLSPGLAGQVHGRGESGKGLDAQEAFLGRSASQMPQGPRANAGPLSEIQVCWGPVALLGTTSLGGHRRQGASCSEEAVVGLWAVPCPPASGLPSFCPPRPRPTASAEPRAPHAHPGAGAGSSPLYTAGHRGSRGPSAQVGAGWESSCQAGRGPLRPGRQRPDPATG